jgi:4-hydroxythreonine-4-phosphate dehydrogenase
MSDKSILVGITQGDVNGIGYEIITKVLLDNQMMEICTPIVYGSSKVASYHRKLMKNCSDFMFNIIKQPGNASTQKANMINITDSEIKIQIGQSTEIAGRMSLLSLQQATEHVLHGDIDVLVTAPVNKKNMQSDKFHFGGQTEYLAACCKSDNYLMLMVDDTLRIGTVTTHCALSTVSKALNKDLIKGKLAILNESLKKDFACTNPRIAVLSLNPHAGEEGMFGNEEAACIQPAIEEAFAEGIYAFGPYPADGLFGSGNYKKFDAILAMYHDQAMVPFKLLSHEGGVNYTAGLPIVRTSPAHGTAYDIAGKCMATETSMRQAIYLACDIYRNRKNYQAE